MILELLDDERESRRKRVGDRDRQIERLGEKEKKIERDKLFT